MRGSTGNVSVRGSKVRGRLDGGESKVRGRLDER